jgi:multicomponent Na+:H+ antiporter subunit C
MAHRSWQLNKHDEVQDDLEDRRLARLASSDQAPPYDLGPDDAVTTLDQDAADARDEMAAMTAEGDDWE